MVGEPRRDREWEHWPGRRAADDGIRHRLRALFTPTDGEDDVEALIVERGREIQERTDQLQATIADLERREEETGRLRSAVEEMLRNGSAELDERHADLNTLAIDLGGREEHVRALERDIAVRRQELGAVELRRAAVERREGAVADREVTLERIAGELTAREQQLAEAERKLDEVLAREAALDAREARLAELTADAESLRRSLAAAQESLLDRERRVGELEALAAALDERERLLEAERASVSAGREELARALATISSGLGLPTGTVGATSLTTTAHVLFLPGAGYHLVEAEGPAPSIAEAVTCDGRPYVVTRVGRSPLPGDARMCAYLEALQSP